MQPENRLKNSLENVLAIVPVRNEEGTIVAVIKSLQSGGVKKIRVVDNGSSDRSADRARTAGAEVVSELIPGYGRACWRGLQELNPEIEWILFCDGDGSDDLCQLPNFLEARENFDLVVGNRGATEAGRKVMTAVQQFGNRLATFLIRWGWGYSYQDLGPFRLIRRSALEQIQMQDRGFGWTVEMQVRAIECNLRICELPVGYFPRQGGKSKISGTISGSFQAGTIILSTLGKLCWRRWQGRRRSRGSGDRGDSRKKENAADSNRIISLNATISGLLILIGALAVLPSGDFRQAAAVLHFGWGMGVMGLGFLLSWRIRCLPGSWFWLVAILSRLLFLRLFPGDDVWRYLWEGYIQTQGFSPYDFAPDAAELIPYRPEWWFLINHPHVSAIYPPLAQLGFRILAAISPSVFLFKLTFATADLWVCWLLYRRFGGRKTLLYAWNPLVIYCFAGGAHYDSWFILPLVAAWLLFDDKNISNYQIKLLFSSFLLGISASIKWMSLPIFSFQAWQICRRSNYKLSAIALVCAFLPLILTALPFCQGGYCPLIPASSDFVVRGRSAEFLPYLISLIWQKAGEVNWIYCFPLGLAILVLLGKAKSFQSFAEGYFSALLVISPIIHAWYFTWLIPFAVATQNLGVRLVSLSAFVYFALLYRQALGDESWFLTNWERWLLWLPFVAGYLWTFSKMNLIFIRGRIGLGTPRKSPGK